MKTQLSGGLEPTKYCGRAKDARPSTRPPNKTNERKTLARAGVTMVIVLLPLILLGQQNLVLNGGFEEYVSCPDDAGQWSNAVHWNNANGSSPDFFHVCGPPIIYAPLDTFPFLGVPDNLFGHQFPHGGDAYMGLYAMQLPDLDGREYIQTQLTDSIVYAVRYQVSFYASLTGEYSRYAISTLGAHLSKEPLSSNSFSVFDVESHIINDPLYPLTDTIDWVLITDTFVSRTGGERFITIGNFHRDVDSDTLFFNPAPPSGNRCAYYYIDDVSVVAIDSIPNGLDEEEAKARMAFKAYPNPNSGSFQLDYSLFGEEKGIVEIHDAIGRLILSQQLQAEGSRMVLTLDVENQGLYILSVRIDGQLRYSEKLNITK